ncbi:hypothetical protein BOTCAL_0034g00370 [Botryotinia calthae]|uniref:Uncharacterized protein n=1 Tax=Botryotinia calthae TaxID=38488 RepID=A0A4Y8DCU4_9HELO|nr:hypothetical protein BOTCAL_0034g00370 [Botryotinia calthae]
MRAVLKTESSSWLEYHDLYCHFELPSASQSVDCTVKRVVHSSEINSSLLLQSLTALEFSTFSG